MSGGLFAAKLKRMDAEDQARISLVTLIILSPGQKLLRDASYRSAQSEENGAADSAV